MGNDRKNRDENDITLDDIEVKEEVTLDIDGEKVDVLVDDQGRPWYTPPESMSDDDKSARTKRINQELSKTLSKAKAERTKQKKRAQALRDKGLKWDDELEEFIEIGPRARETKEEPRPTDGSAGISDEVLVKAYEDTYHKSMLDILGVKTQADLEELKEDEPGKYDRAHISATAKANAAQIKLGQKVQMDNIRKSSEASTLENKLISTVGRDAKYDHDPAKVLAYANRPGS